MVAINICYFWYLQMMMHVLLVVGVQSHDQIPQTHIPEHCMLRYVGSDYA